jgi:hypothetical protein
MLMIKDLPASHELDDKEMAAVRGGYHEKSYGSDYGSSSYAPPTGYGSSSCAPTGYAPTGYDSHDSYGSYDSYGYDSHDSYKAPKDTYSSPKKYSYS